MFDKVGFVTCLNNYKKGHAYLARKEVEAIRAGTDPRLLELKEAFGVRVLEPLCEIYCSATQPERAVLEGLIRAVGYFGGFIKLEA